jgi:hypothetical protein
MAKDWFCLPVWQAISKLAVQTQTHMQTDIAIYIKKAYDKSVWSPKSSKMKRV